MNIPDEAVEAAAKAHYAASRSTRPWDESAPMVRRIGLKKMRAALEAAAPHLMAQAWQEGEDADGVINIIHALRADGSQCRSAMDGDCYWRSCPQLRDSEPKATGRHCPLDGSAGAGE